MSRNQQKTDTDEFLPARLELIPCFALLAAGFAFMGLCGTTSAKVLFAQTANDTSTGDSVDPSDSDGGFQVADDFTPAHDATVRSVKWWGGYGFSNTPLVPLSFQLVFYADAGGLPDPNQIISSTAVQFNALEAPVDVFSGTDIYEFRANVTPTPVPANTKVWFSVLANTDNDSDDTFYWRADNLGDSASKFGEAFIESSSRLLFVLNDTPLRPVTAIFADDFSAGGVLNGTAPDTRPGGETWVASSDWQANGTTASVVSTSEDDSAFLPFVPQPGKIYTLSAALNQSTGGSGSAPWAGFGFAASNNTGRFQNAPNNPSPWMFYPLSGLIRTITGPGTTGTAFEQTYSGPQTLKIVLDTTAPNWTVEWFVGFKSVRTHVFTANPTITHIGIGREDGAAADFDAFSLTVEDGDVAPRIVAFSAVGGGVWELDLTGNPGMPYGFRSSSDLVFNPGALVENLSKGDPGDPGTISGPNNSVVTTDASGDARVRMVLAGQPRGFVRAFSLP